MSHAPEQLPASSVEATPEIACPAGALALATGSAIYRDMWAVVFADGHIVTGSDLQSEAEAWRIALGWPGPGEIEHAKKQGAFAVKCRLRYFQPNTQSSRGTAQP